MARDTDLSFIWVETQPKPWAQMKSLTVAQATEERAGEHENLWSKPRKKSHLRSDQRGQTEASETAGTQAGSFQEGGGRR